ncbi:protein translocase subunit SecD [bacterium]|nr:protein translocase subunit SecD [bacterium]
MSPRKLLLLVVVLLTLGALYVIQDEKQFPTKYGLDIQGGMHLVLEAKDTEKIKVTPEVMQSVIAVVRNRVDATGVNEPVIQRKGDRQVLVELAGVKDPDAARQLLGKTAHLTFWELPAGVVAPMTASSSQPAWVKTPLDGSMLDEAKAEPSPQGGWQIAIKFNSEGAKLFGEISSRNVGKPVAIRLDETEISAPRIEGPILGGSAQITGSFDAKTAQMLAVQLKAGSLPVPLEEVETRTVGPTLGQDTVKASVTAGLIGFGLVVLFMLFYYRLPGLVADISLAIYAVLVFAIFKLIPVTLTVPGIAGFILSIGMAVDANVLIFERTKEELRNGRSLYSAIEIGFKRAFTSIFDSNSTTLLTCAILYYFGSGLVRGFALTLAIGVIVSLFTAITVSRALLHAILEGGGKGLKSPEYFGVKQPGTATEKAS